MLLAVVLRTSFQMLINLTDDRTEECRDNQHGYADDVLCCERDSQDGLIPVSTNHDDSPKLLY